MSMETPKDFATLSPREMESRAEVLFAMDLLMHHLNDEDDIEGWLMNGVPDGAPVFRMSDEHLGYYLACLDDGFEDIVRLFAKIVRRVCFKITYEPKGFC